MAIGAVDRIKGFEPTAKPETAGATAYRAQDASVFPAASTETAGSTACGGGSSSGGSFNAIA